MSSLWVYAQTVESYPSPSLSESLVWWFILGSALGHLKEWESKEEVNREEVKAEVEELGCEMVEAGDPGLLKKKGSVLQKELVIDD